MLVGLAAFLSFSGCGTEAPPPPPPAPAPAPEPPPPPPAPAEPAVMMVDGLGAAHAANAGKPVKVQGFYNAMTKQDKPPQINVDMNSAADLSGAKAVCVMDAGKEADVASVAQKSQITVSGTLAADKMGDAERIDNCTIDPAATVAPAPAEGGEKDGKAKAKAKAKNGG